jgi:hypothetical protein
MLIALAAAIVLAQASPAPPAPAAAQPPAKAVEATAPAKPAKPKLICHDETPVGSIISQRVCRTPQQVEADRQQSNRSNDALSDHIAACHGAPSC